MLSAGMKIATYANARTALEARKGVAPAFMTGESFRQLNIVATCQLRPPALYITSTSVRLAALRCREVLGHDDSYHL